MISRFAVHILDIAQLVTWLITRHLYKYSGGLKDKLSINKG